MNYKEIINNEEKEVPFYELPSAVKEMIKQFGKGISISVSNNINDTTVRYEPILPKKITNLELAKKYLGENLQFQYETYTGKDVSLSTTIEEKYCLNNGHYNPDENFGDEKSIELFEDFEEAFFAYLRSCGIIPD